MAKHRRFKVTRNLTPWRREEIPDEHMEFAQRRVDYLEGSAFNHPLQYLLACAYLQGINDCVQAHINNPTLSAPSATSDRSTDAT